MSHWLFTSLIRPVQQLLPSQGQRVLTSDHSSPLVLITSPQMTKSSHHYFPPNDKEFSPPLPSKWQRVLTTTSLQMTEFSPLLPSKWQSSHHYFPPNDKEFSPPLPSKWQRVLTSNHFLRHAVEASNALQTDGCLCEVGEVAGITGHWLTTPQGAVEANGTWSRRGVGDVIATGAVKAWVTVTHWGWQPWNQKEKLELQIKEQE